MSEFKPVRRLDFEKARDEKIKFLADHRLMVLATSYNNRVTARTVSYASDVLDIYFMSWEHHTKCVQIKENPLIASCIDNVQIEGKARILGNPMDKKNEAYANIYRTKLPDVFKNFAYQPGMVMVKVTPTFMVTWVKENNLRYLEHLNLVSKVSYVFEEINL